MSARRLFSWPVALSLILISVSVVLYAIHYFFFHDLHHILIYLVGDIAFLPIEVLLVTVVLHRLLNEREKRQMLKKMNMVIGAFFSEVGLPLLRSFVCFDQEVKSIQEALLVRTDWQEKEFQALHRQIQNYQCRIDGGKGDLQGVRSLLIQKRSFLLLLLENPLLLEHESFTNLLWAVFHLMEELENRSSLQNVPDSDLVHLFGDIKRAYTALLSEWIDYMKHLKENYPYLFSLALRTNPFDTQASPIVY